MSLEIFSVSMDTIELKKNQMIEIQIESSFMKRGSLSSIFTELVVHFWANTIVGQ